MESNNLRPEILDLVRKYWVNKPLEAFSPGESHVSVSGKLIDSEDIVTLVDSCLDGWFTSGKYTAMFEKELAKYIGVRNSLFVNSGSSANLLALTALTSKRLGKGKLEPGDEIITAATGFATTLNPIIQNGLTPVFVDMDLDTLNVDVNQVEEAISPRTKGIMMAHTLGNPFALDEIINLCNENNLWLIEDNCDALGSKYKGKLTGSFGDLATQSFYPAHHITSGEGGAVLVNSPSLRKEIESLRDWGRDCYCPSGVDNTCHKRFEWQLGSLPKGYDHKYIYSKVGYNLKATEMQASLALSQLSKIEVFGEARKNNFEFYKDKLSNLESLAFVEATIDSSPSWFGFPIRVTQKARFSRNEIVGHLNSRNIGTRLLFAGNLTKQPAYEGINFRKVSDLAVADNLMNNAFWIGVQPNLSVDQMTYVADTIKAFVQLSE